MARFPAAGRPEAEPPPPWLAGCLAVCCAFGWTALPPCLTAQEPPASPDTQQDPVEPKAQRPTVREAMAALDRWLESERGDRALMDAAAQRILEAGEPALVAFGKRIRSTPTDDIQRRAGLDGVLTALGISYLDQQAERGMVYAGQFQPLAPLQPWIGQLYLRLLLDPPDWFPSTRRAELVPALRDLFDGAPPAEAVDRMEGLAEDVRREPENLRLQLTFALAQWGRGELAVKLVDDLEQQTNDPNPSRRIYPLSVLADVHYQMRNYRAAMATHARHLELIEEQGEVVRPMDYYNAACCAALAAEPEQAIAWLRQCARLQRSESIDKSVKLERSLFDEDPDLELIRRDPRFAEIVRQAFPPAKDDTGGAGDGGDKGGGGR